MLVLFLFSSPICGGTPTFIIEPKTTESKKAEKSLEISAFLVFSCLHLNQTLMMAGVAGFGPTNARVKVWCLTAWLHPNIGTAEPGGRWPPASAAGALFSVAQSLYHIPLRLSRCTGVFFMPSGGRMPKRRGCRKEPVGGQTCMTVGNRPGERLPTARRTERRNPAGKGAAGKHPMAGLRADGSINRWQAERPAARQPGRQSGTKDGGLRMAAMRKNGPPGGAPGAPARRAAGGRQGIKGRRTRTRLPASGPDPGIRSGRARKKDPAS